MVTFRRFGKLGRFGNQLFQYAGVHLYALKHGYKAVMPSWIGNDIFKNVQSWTSGEKLSAQFLLTRQLDDMQSWNRWGRIKYMLRIWKTLPETHSLQKLHEQPKDNINFYGYMQDPYSLQLLQENKELVRSWFTFKDEIEKPLQELIADHKPYIAIHIRRGDFVRIGTALSVDQYKQELKKVAGDRPVYIASDDPKMINEFKEFNTFQIKKPDIEHLSYPTFDFWMLMHAQTILGGGSTFSWWAAYLSDADYYAPPLTHTWPENYKAVFEKQTV